jgi:transposase
MDYPPSAWRRIMKIQEIFERARHQDLTWQEAAEILGVDGRTVRRWKQMAAKSGFEALLDKRTRRPSPRRVPDQVRKTVIELYRDTYRDWNIKHFHEQLPKQGVRYGYTWTKKVLQEAHLYSPKIKRTTHRKKRDRKPLPGMMLHIDGSKHRWIPLLEGYQDLIVVLDDATNRVYYAKLVSEENTLECMLALKQVVESQGLFCSLYSDRGSHFFHTSQAGNKVDPSKLTQIGRALYELGIEAIPAYSPQARGRCERFFGTWQGRLPNELKLHNIRSLPEANRYIDATFLPWHNASLTVSPRSETSAFTPYLGKDLKYILCIKEHRLVNHDNTVQWHNRFLQIQPAQFRISFAKCKVMVCLHLDGTISILYGHHIIGTYDQEGNPLQLIIQKKKRTNHVLQKADILTCY